mmetsp:Transcript_32772/g.84649  ORF Transcript_32772/g.84649 Transcript_32772/m.84649 type:complete len:245 (-) Transcript_32772:252-986(-)
MGIPQKGAKGKGKGKGKGKPHAKPAANTLPSFRDLKEKANELYDEPALETVLQEEFTKTKMREVKQFAKIPTTGRKRFAEASFDESDRQAFVSGFRKRKDERRRIAGEIKQEKARLQKVLERRERKEARKAAMENNVYGVDDDDEEGDSGAAGVEASESNKEGRKAQLKGGRKEGEKRKGGEKGRGRGGVEKKGNFLIAKKRTKVSKTEVNEQVEVEKKEMSKEKYATSDGGVATVTVKSLHFG